MFIHIDAEKTEMFALLVNTVKICFFDEARDSLVCHERPGRERGNRCEVKVRRLAPGA